MRTIIVTSDGMSTMDEEHDPDEILDYTFDWSGILVTGETISTSVWAVSSNVTAGTSSNTTTGATQWITAVIASSTALDMRNTITTSDARTHQRTMLINVIEK